MSDTFTFAILTLSDKGYKGLREDSSGNYIKEFFMNKGKLLHYEIIPDDKDLIIDRLITLTDKVDIIFTTGGTGLSPRDVTPEATLSVIDRQIPGIAEAMRSEGFKKTKHAILSRAVAGQRGGTLIINLPGSLKAVRENLEIIEDVIPHAVSKIKGDTSDCGR
ncbi:MAG: MogA/MoaB family molybdenum cofactor biosynthesis protein [Thermodesulfovibrionales bacterium]|nr:MogA/MoaB family molybdenum cofactor biosynthesis protein [Thermodesulfovibrionales bacterium]